MIGCPHKPRRVEWLRSTRVVMVGLAVLALPWCAGCDAASAGNSAAEASEIPIAVPVADDIEVLGKASLEYLEIALSELEQPDALSDSAPLPPDPSVPGPLPPNPFAPGPASGSQDPPPPPPPPCAEDIRQLTHGCVEQTRDIAAAGIEEITRLFQEGQFEEAHLAARECIEQINLHTRECLHALRDLCRECMAELLEHEAPIEVIEALLRACCRATDHMLYARRGAVGAIEDAVDRGEVHTCVTQVRQVAVDCAEHNDQIADECVARIEELLANGQVEEAVAAAHECIQAIHGHTADCIGAVREACQRCLLHLIRNCANGTLIHHVHEACEANVTLILHSAHRAVERIRHALPPPPEDLEA